jgi:hypothetical protein
MCFRERNEIHSNHLLGELIEDGDKHEVGYHYLPLWVIILLLHVHNFFCRLA